MNSGKKPASVQKIIGFCGILIFITAGIFAFGHTPVNAVAPDNWQWVKHVDGILGAGQMASVVVDPTDQNTSYILTVNSGVYKTTNGGTSWSAVNTGLPSDKSVGASNLVGNQLTIDPNNHLTLYAQINGKVYKTTDGGNNWSDINNGIQFSSGIAAIVGVIVDPTNSNHLYAASITSSSSGGVWQSTNGGSNWTQIAGAAYGGGSLGGEGENDAWPLAMDPSDTSKLYFSAVHIENYRSSDSGLNWSAINLPAPPVNGEGAAIAINPTSHKVFIGMTSGLAVSTDYGVTWSDVSTFDNQWIADIKFAPSNSTIMYAITSSGKIYKSTDSGLTWSLMSTNSTLIYYSFAISNSDPTVLYIATHGNGAYKSTNSGTSISTINTGLPLSANITLQGLAQSKSSPDTVYLSVTNNALYKSTDAGYTWSSVNSSTIPTILRVDPTNASILLAVSGGNLIRSSDGGVSWTTVRAGFDALDIVFAPSNHNIVLAQGNACCGVIKSVNNGLAWSAVSFFTGLIFYRSGIDIDPQNENIMYAAPTTGSGPYKSTDGGNTWTAINSGITDTSGYSITVNPKNSSQLFFGSWNDDIYFRSNNGGTSFTQVLALHSYSDFNAAHVSFDKDNVNIVYAGADAGKMGYISTDGGTGWSVLPSTGLTGYDSLQIASLKNTKEILSTDSYSNFYIYEKDIPKFDQSTIAVANSNGKNNFKPGDTLNFTAIIKNIGPAQTNNPYIPLELPPALHFVSGSVKKDGASVSSDPVSGSVLTLTGNLLNYNKSVTLTFQAKIDSSYSSTMVLHPTVKSDEDTAGTSIADVPITVDGTGNSSGTSNPNCKNNYKHCSNAGQNYVGTPAFIQSDTGESSTGVLITSQTDHNDLSLTVNQLKLTDLSSAVTNLVTGGNSDVPTPSITSVPYPWSQGLNTYSEFYQFSAVSAFNGYPILKTDNPFIIRLSYDSAKLQGNDPTTLKVAYFDHDRNKWIIVPAPTVVDWVNHTVSTTTRRFALYVLVYPSKTFGEEQSVSDSSNINNPVLGTETQEQSTTPVPQPTVPQNVSQTKSGNHKTCVLWNLICW